LNFRPGCPFFLTKRLFTVNYKKSSTGGKLFEGFYLSGEVFLTKGVDDGNDKKYWLGGIKSAPGAISGENIRILLLASG
jgi:hypothetical protein